MSEVFSVVRLYEGQSEVLCLHPTKPVADACCLTKANTRAWVNGMEAAFVDARGDLATSGREAYRVEPHEVRQVSCSEPCPESVKNAGEQLNMSGEILSRVTNEEAAEAARVLRKIEALDLVGDDREAHALKITRQQLESWVRNKSGILSLQVFQDEVFRERAEEALIDYPEEPEKHEKWRKLLFRNSSPTTDAKRDAFQQITPKTQAEVDASIAATDAEDAAEDARAIAIERFWAHEKNIPVHHEVRASLVSIPAWLIADVDGNHVFSGAPDDVEGFLFFVDEEPAANWAHECRYVFVFLSGAFAISSREWPPASDIYDKLEKIEAPRH